VARYPLIFLGTALLAAACSSDSPLGSEADDVADTPSAEEPVVESEDSVEPADSDSESLPITERAHGVPLEDIHFDTFDGGSVPLSEAPPELIARLLDAIPPIDNPSYETASEAAWLTVDDVVLGYVDDDGEAWAYPVRILDLHEIVNDELAGRPVLISYCPLCGSGVVYDRKLGDETLTFSNTSALYENDLVMIDRETGSYWWQVAGRGIVGRLTDEMLTPLPAEMARWGQWTERHPDTNVLARPIGRDYSRTLFAGYADQVDLGRTPFPVSEDVLGDERLSPGTSVIVVERNGQNWAWPIEPASDRETVLGDLAVRVITDGTGGRVETLDGEVMPSRTSLWFAIVASFPDVKLGS